MGGMGSGRRWHIGAIGTTSDYREFNVWLLQQNGQLTPGKSFNLFWTSNGETAASIKVLTEADKLTLIYWNQHRHGPWQRLEYPVRLDWTACNYGGRRAWFLCPAQGCGRRVAMLYVVSASGIFTCRHCNQLAFASQRETADDRAARRANTIRRRLGWRVGIFHPSGGKPKGMHWRTYYRLIAEHNTFAGVTLAGLAQQFGIKL